MYTMKEVGYPHSLLYYTWEIIYHNSIHCF